MNEEEAGEEDEEDEGDDAFDRATPQPRISPHLWGPCLYYKGLEDLEDLEGLEGFCIGGFMMRRFGIEQLRSLGLTRHRTNSTRKSRYIMEGGYDVVAPRWGSWGRSARPARTQSTISSCIGTRKVRNRINPNK